MLQFLSCLALCGVLLCSTPGPVHAGSLSTWNEIDNPELPAMFLQGAIERPDGSTQHFFIGNFHDSLATPKPLLIFLEGSGAQSQFMRMGDQIGYGMFGVFAQEAGAEYCIVAPEKRGVTFGENHQGSAEGASAEYHTWATWEGRRDEVLRLLDVLLADPLIDPARVVLVGHSEGADVAAAVAAADARVTHVAFLSGGGPTQLFDLMILRRRALNAAGATPEETEAAMSAFEEEAVALMADPDNAEKQFMGHAYRRWASFCGHPPVESLAATEARLFLAQGSADQSVPVESFDLLVADLIRRGAAGRLTIRRLPGADHGYLRPESAPGYEPFLDLFHEILDWARPFESAG